MDAIVRPQLTTILKLQLRYVQCCLYATGKVSEKFRGWGSGPPLSDPFPVLPPPPTMSENTRAGGDEVWCDYNVYIVTEGLQNRPESRGIT